MSSPYVSDRTQGRRSRGGSRERWHAGGDQPRRRRRHASAPVLLQESDDAAPVLGQLQSQVTALTNTCETLKSELKRVTDLASVMQQTLTGLRTATELTSAAARHIERASYRQPLHGYP